MSSPRSPLARLALAAAVGALLATAAVTPAAAGDGRGGIPGGSGGSPGAEAHRAAAQRAGTHGDRDPRFHRGFVAVRGGVALHSRPDFRSRVLRIARPGEIVWIYCRTPGHDAHGGRVWYLLADRAWAWAPARAIATTWPAPRWC
ncbi:SH3 domain-containing protein [Streptomyces sp. NTH33]|uniref:SH3 domain-containing protein n=1 Tax=Streptomyces sp. NTH33 TaxID=1735453 RepID=UPI000DAAA8ED|nr:SH3 domain-containing protein [Streptomyces sp. NTH33]PZH06437.1 SH3 domain-containing protein [Streptomyces sp. NTH33]